LSESFVDGVLRIVEVPIVKLSPIDAEWVVRALVGPRYEPVERDRHVTRYEGHTFDDLLAREQHDARSGAVMPPIWRAQNDGTTVRARSLHALM
jgi:hypothetical protein